MSRPPIRNAAAPLTIPTPGNVGSPIHPGVVVLDAPFGGYTHWMAYTPYPPAGEAAENPCVVASNDGITWVVPAGLTNPLDPIPGDVTMDANHFNSDTDIYHHDGTLYLFWRRTDGTASTATIYVRTSTDGVTWTPRQVVLTGPRSDGYVSPFFHHDGELWHMWHGGTNQMIGFRHRQAASLTGPWSAPQDCTLTDLEPYRWTWHFGATYHDGLHIGILQATAKPTTATRGVLFLAVSRDGITWKLGPCVLQPRPAAAGFPIPWDGVTLYRGTLVVAGDVLRIWYSAIDGPVRGIGYTEAPLSLIGVALDALDA